MKIENEWELVQLRLPNAANGTEAFLEFIDASFGVHKLREACEKRMRVGSDTDRDETIFHTVDDFFFVGSFSRTWDETLTSGHVNEDDWIVFRMEVLFHWSKFLPTRYRRGGVVEW